MALGMTEISINGLLTEKDVERLAHHTRTGSVGPTTVYYAGVTGPIISASVALITRHALNSVGFSNYWQLLLSAIVAASAGIVWYLIFIRWSYRHKFGRGTEVCISTEIKASADGLIVKRDDITTAIGWTAVRSIESWRKYTVVIIAGADALIIPDRWFAKDEQARLEFVADLNEQLRSSQLGLT